ncbi:MAG TPA: hypothetical protein DIU00_00300 [Phycisphaerales bacterium]|nr:hypothetical protein [Phycisphaerales bacterium]
MKNRVFIIAALLSATFFTPISWSIENPGIGNPVGPSTIPPSTIRSGLVSTPAPIDTTGNLLITGNVRGGRYFRGTVPYRAATSFSSTLGSSSLNSFLRDTAGSEDFRTYSRQYGTRPYYSRSGTVTTMMPGRSEILAPTGTMMNTRAQQDTRSAGAGVFGMESMPQESALSGRSVGADDSGLRGPITQYGRLAESQLTFQDTFPSGMSPGRRDKEQLTPDRAGIRRQDRSSAVELFREQTQDSTTLLFPERRQSPSETIDALKYLNRQTNNENLRPDFESRTIPSRQTVERKQNTAVPYEFSPSEKFKPSMDSRLQKNLFLHKDTNWSAESLESKSIPERRVPGTLGVPEANRLETSGLNRTQQNQQQGDVLDQIRKQLDDLTKSIDENIQRREARRAAGTDQAVIRERTPLGSEQYMPKSREGIISPDPINSSGASSYYEQRGAELRFKGEEPSLPTGRELSRTKGGRGTGLEFSGVPGYESPQKKSSPLDELNKLSQADISAEASRIMGKHRSLESLSDSKFDQHMRAAEHYLRAGEYYRAAGCFSLATMYQSDNPLALAGRGHALLAAGEYVSSALFLSRALQVSPEYLQMRIDLTAMLDDERKLAGRVEDIEQWLARSGSSQLQFLLGYIYYRTGQLLEAKKAIDAAYEKAPDSPAVQVMKITIDNAILRP